MTLSGISSNLSTTAYFGLKAPSKSFCNCVEVLLVSEQK